MNSLKETQEHPQEYKYFLGFNNVGTTRFEMTQVGQFLAAEGCAIPIYLGKPQKTAFF